MGMSSNKPAILVRLHPYLLDRLNKRTQTGSRNAFINEAIAAALEVPPPPRSMQEAIDDRWADFTARSELYRERPKDLPRQTPAEARADAEEHGRAIGWDAATIEQYAKSSEQIAEWLLNKDNLERLRNRKQAELMDIEAALEAATKGPANT